MVLGGWVFFEILVVQNQYGSLQKVEVLIFKIQKKEELTGGGIVKLCWSHEQQ